MNGSFLWQSLVLILAGLSLLRLSGRKSISQMTIAQTIVMISIGTIIVQPIVEKSTIKAIVASAIFVAVTVLLEYLQVKFNPFEKLITGKSKIVIQNGTVNSMNLRKLRMSVDQLEMRLRNVGITKISDIKTATIEANGLLGYELMEDAKPVTVGELKKILSLYMKPIQEQADNATNQSSSNKEMENIFTEIEKSIQNHPDYLN
ncbi:DUF421 domain-containing protein [Neobacillus dielmonensis]|uniref:DUF421 domain-containing protein n=1 Tax=Neobacillus dielmonensis TaxID=1347369 RepID=UPI0005AACDEF|nr:YetF domain-containing protein [Neobacillus dielmonensis]